MFVISIRQYRILRAVIKRNDTGEPVTQADLHDLSKLAPGEDIQTSYMAIRRLIKAEALETSKDFRDPRATVVRITDWGRELYDRAVTALDREDGSAAGSILKLTREIETVLAHEGAIYHLRRDLASLDAAVERAKYLLDEWHEQERPEREAHIAGEAASAAKYKAQHEQEAKIKAAVVDLLRETGPYPTISAAVRAVAESGLDFLVRDEHGHFPCYQIGEHKIYLGQWRLRKWLIEARLWFPRSGT